MTEQGPDSTPSPSPEGKNALAPGRDWKEICAAAVNWLPDQILAPRTTPLTPDHLKQAMGASRRAYIEVLQGLRRRGTGTDPITVTSRATDNSRNNWFNGLVAEIAGKRLNAREGYPHTAMVDLLMDGRWGPEARNFFKKENIKIECAPALEEPARLEAAATGIAGAIGRAVKEGAEGKKLRALLREPDATQLRSSSGKVTLDEAIEVIDIPLSPKGFDRYFRENSRAGDSENVELVAAVKAALTEKHNITVKGDQESTGKSGSNGHPLKNLGSAITAGWERFKDWKEAPKFSNAADEVGGAANRMYREYLAWRRKADKEAGEKCGLSFREEDEEKKEGSISFYVKVMKKLEEALVGRFGRQSASEGVVNVRGRLNEGGWDLKFVEKEPLPEPRIVEQVIARLKEKTGIGQEKGGVKKSMTFSDRAEAMKWVRFWVRKTDTPPESDALIGKVVYELETQNFIILRQEDPVTSSQSSGAEEAPVETPKES